MPESTANISSLTTQPAIPKSAVASFIETVNVLTLGYFMDNVVNKTPVCSY